MSFFQDVFTTTRGMIPTWLVILVPTLITFYTYTTWNFGVFKKLGVRGPRPYPIIGTMWLFMTKGLTVHDLEMRKYGTVVGTFLGRNPSMLIYDVDILKQILVKDFNNFQDRMVAEITEYPISKMITLLKGDHWRHVRNIMTPTFSSGKLRKMNHQINKCATSLLKTLEEKASKNEVFEFKGLCGAYTMDVIASTAFGLQINSHDDPNNQFIRHAKTFFEFKFTNPKTILLFFFPFLLNPLSKLGFSIFPKECIKFFVNVVDQAFEGRQKEDISKANQTDFLQLLVNADISDVDKDDETATAADNSKSKNWSEKGLTHEEVLAQSLVFFLAGFETTANTLSLFGYCLATNPECQEKAIKEVDDVIKGEEELITYDMVQKLPYMDMCLNEVLRLYPAAARTDRAALNDVTINGVFIPKGMVIGVPIYALQMDPEIWPEPEKFNPERFSAEEKEGRNPYYYMPFGMGPRNCVGMRLALMELKIAMVHILQKFKLVTCPETEIPLKLNKIATKAENGIKIKAVNRNIFRQKKSPQVL